MGRLWDKWTGTRYPDRDVKPLPTLEEQWGNLSYEHSGRQYARGGSTRIARQWEFQKGPDGRRRLVETFRYDSRDMKDPLRDTVLTAGWTWRGVLFTW
ncbi:hypothetical protein [Streptomyces sp. NBC_00091]|uniref:hypothetical protein n=1 Tax=Streptomyces sp. NBC_00091 TaxID=2975648 RepID=UPI00225BEE1C|nr:hypothetical protein [Streptomyces sp. NBC_00091]MCX5376206.1 hypothetical protein [Streptomyces sp. NBC_00091]